MLSSKRGDTLVEVLLAFAIFALIMVGTMTIMNRSVAVAQRTVEQTQVRQVLNGQADMLRHVRDSGSTVWGQIKQPTRLVTNPVKAQSLTSACPSSQPTNSFVVSTNSSGVPSYVSLNSATFAKASIESKIEYGALRPAHGVWVQAVRVSGTPVAYDMYIRACWDSVGTSVPMTIGTIVRLYDK